MRKGDHIILIGMMGTGKSSVGEVLAKELDIPFIDLDRRVEEQTGMRVAEIFQKKGRAYFRDLESLELEKIRKELPSSVATGGGVVIRSENRKTLRELGWVVWLQATPEVILERLGEKAEIIRPLLMGEDRLGRLRVLLSEREGLYKEIADYTIDTSLLDIPTIVRRIIQHMDRVGG